ncbi:MAG TPA: c-type cytochrome domain-containing protein, partial [Gemmataceae bacterium]|nr:c-type cytochrome domain-containing protein [Gemmataceae bacterium]
MRSMLLSGLLACLVASTGSVRTLLAEDLFADKIAPILRKRCVTCHNPTKVRGGLDLTTGEGLQKGGEKGAVIVGRSPEKSRLLEMVSGPKPRMPKQGPKLTADEAADLRKWIEGGADWPKAITLGDAAKNRAGPNWWSLQPLKLPDIPVVKDRSWCKT